MEKLLIPLALLPIVAGFQFGRIWEPTRYQIARSDGQKLYLTSAYYGYFIALALFASICSFDCWILDLCSVHERCFGHFAGVTFVLSPLVAWPAAKLLNLFVNEYDYWSKAVESNELEKTLLYARIDSESVMVTLSNNKVYVGYVTIIADPNQQHDRDWIELFLTLSGYRDGEFRVHYTLNYLEMMAKTLFADEQNKELDSNQPEVEAENSESVQQSKQDDKDMAYQNFMIALPVSEIISVHRYDAKIALLAQQAQDTAQTETPDDRHHH
ncbi:MAG: hypothetical protein KKC01_08075 [Gammaproteobacteria bacterium]|nr:hypothetical protein [Gammaproteobacteria bacterium]